MASNDQYVSVQFSSMPANVVVLRPVRAHFELKQNYFHLNTVDKHVPHLFRSISNQLGEPAVQIDTQTAEKVSYFVSNFLAIAFEDSQFLKQVFNMPQFLFKRKRNHFVNGR